MVKLIKVVSNDGGSKTTTYEADDGNTYTLSGDLGVRANNPSNISPSVDGRQFWIDNFGAIGFVPSSKGQPWVAVFPTRSAGIAAQQYLWSTPAYQNITLGQAAGRWATDSYAADLAAAAGVTLDTPVRDLSPEQMQAIFSAQLENEGSSNLVVTDANGNKLDPAIITGDHPVPPGTIADSPFDVLQNLKDRADEAKGYGAIPPTPIERPASFNETGAPPIPAMKADLVEELQRRTEEAAKLAVTPRLPENYDKPGAYSPEQLRQFAIGNVPTMDQSNVQARATLLDEGFGSLLSSGINPATPNPRTTAPTFEPGMLGRTGGTAAPSRPAETVEPAQGRGNVEPVPTAQVRQPTMTTVNGKTVPLGATVIQGGKLLMVVEGPDGKGKLQNVEDISNDWLRTNVDPNAPLLFEKSLAGDAARAIAAPMIKQGVDSALVDAKYAVGNAVGGVVNGAMGLLDGLGQKVASLAQSPSKTVAPVSANANLNQAKAEQAAQRPSSSSSSLSAPAQGLSAAERNAIAAYTPPSLSAPGAGLTADQKNAMVKVPVTTTVANPAYDDWVAKYGDGSQVQTAATGGMVTKNQLAAIQNVNGAVQKPIVPAAPPKTITVTTTKTIPVKVSAPPVQKTGISLLDALVTIAGSGKTQAPRDASGKPIAIGGVKDRSTGATYSSSGGNYGSDPGQVTAGLKPGDRVYNADTNSWGLKG